MHQVLRKLEKVNQAQSKGKLEKFLKKKAVPVVLGPPHKHGQGPGPWWYIIGLAHR